MEIKVDPYMMTCIWMSQFPDFYLKQYLLYKDIHPKLVSLMIMGRITPTQAMNVLDYARENNLI